MKIIRFPEKNWNKFAWYENDITSCKPTNRFKSQTRKDICDHEDFFNTSNTADYTELKVSCYNIVKRYNDCVIVYNTASEAVASMSPCEYDVLLQYGGKSGTNMPLHIHNNPLYDTFFKLGFLVDATDTETDKIHLIRKRTMCLERNLKSFVICPTYECNARCFFCFARDDVRHNFRMSLPTADDVLNFIYNQIRPNDEVIFIWFGGEPLMAENVIDYILNNFDKHFNGTVKFSSVFQTNGSLLTDGLLEKAIYDWHTKEFQISIEAYQTEHDKRKNYLQKNTNQYERVLQNVEKIINKEVRCLLRIHIDNKNTNDFTRILEDLEDFRENNYLKLYATTLHVPEHVTKYDNYVHYSQFNDIYRLIYTELYRKHWIKDICDIIPRRKMIRCVARSMNSFLIGADGKLFRCEQENHDREHCVGNCKTGIIHNEHLAIFMDMDVEEKCNVCQYLPICQGGCKYYWLRNNPDISPCVRQVHYMDTIFDLIHEWTLKNN